MTPTAELVQIDLSPLKLARKPGQVGLVKHGCNTGFKEKLPIEIRFQSYDNLENLEAGKSSTYSY